MEPDRISNLPDNAIEGILMHLPIRDAVRTSLLSSKWRYKWAMIPHLVFDDNLFHQFSSQNEAVMESKIVSIIDQVLLLHVGPIRKFELSHSEVVAVADIDRWILHLSRNSIKNIALTICKGEAYRVPSCLFSCQGLTLLELYNCSLKPPSTITVFKELKILDLQYVTLEQDFLENLISGCPDLEVICFSNVEGLSRIKINTPKLRFFDFEGSLEVVSFENTFNLEHVVISFPEKVKNNQRWTLGNSRNLLNFFANLHNIKRLQLHDHSLKYLAVGIEPRKLPEPCAKLFHLSMHINLNNREESVTSLCLLNIAPNLEELKIEVRTGAGIDTNFWEDYSNSPFSKLGFVEVTGISGAKSELDFIKFMLLNSPVLERMVVKPASRSLRCELVTELLRFRRASNQAEIIYFDPIPCDRGNTLINFNI